MRNFDAVVAGAGIWGCTVARRLADAGKHVLVLEKRRAVGGNCRCRTIDGIEVHLYGSHIFHTSDEEVWKFVTRFTKFNDYRHCVLAKTCVKYDADHHSSTSTSDFNLYHLPIGRTLLREFFGIDLGDRSLKEFLSTPIADQTSNHPNLQSSNHPNLQTSHTYGDAIFEAFIKGYTAKQWGMPADKVDPSIIARLKVRDNYSTDYFDDPHQGIPLDGYNELFRRMLDHENIVLRTNSSLKLKPRDGRFFIFDEKKKIEIPLSNSNSKLQLYYSGPLDALFNYKCGALPWRSLRFETEHVARRDFQGATVVNYTDASVPYTRIHEFRHYHPEAKGAFAKPKGTIITREYPSDWKIGDEPYYPIDNEESRALLGKYQDELKALNLHSSTSTPNFNLIIGGRLGEYKYYDMDKSIAAALAVEL